MPGKKKKGRTKRPFCTVNHARISSLLAAGARQILGGDRGVGRVGAAPVDAATVIHSRQAKLQALNLGASRRATEDGDDHARLRRASINRADVLAADGRSIRGQTSRGVVRR